MPVEMDSSPRHSLVASIAGASLIGDGLLVRLRSTLIGLLGAVTAVGLSLVVVISQIGWPSVVSGPIPDGPAAAVVRNDTIAPPPLVPRGPRSSAAQGRVHGHRGAVSADEGSGPSLALATSRQTGPTPVTPAPPAKPPPSSTGQPPTTGQSSPAPATTPAAKAPPAAKEPPAKEPTAPSPPATASDSPGHSGESHGGGPPPWAPAGGGDHGNGDEHGKPDWAGH
jgi:hypothetical protein